MPTLQEDQAFIESIAPAAVGFFTTRRFSAAVNIAQGCLESLYGTECPTANGVNSHNLYGIKADPSWRGPSVLVPTQEWENGGYVTIHAPFRAYPSFGDSVTDHNNFFVENSRYNNLFGVDYTRSADTIAAVDHYATDPTYGEKLLSIIAQFGLSKYDQLPPSHYAVTVGYFSSQEQATAGSDRIQKECKYHTMRIQHVGKAPDGNQRWTVQVGYFANETQGKAAEEIIQKATGYHCMTVQGVQ